MSESKIARTETNSPPGKNNGDIGTMHSNKLAYFSLNNESTISRAHYDRGTSFHVLF